MSPWFWAGIAAGLYCLVRGIADLRRRSYLWGVLGLASAAIVLLTPNPLNRLSMTVPAGTTP